MTVSTLLRAIPHECPRANVRLNRSTRHPTTVYMTEISGFTRCVRVAAARTQRNGLHVREDLRGEQFQMVEVG